MTAGEAKHRHLTENDLHEYARDPTRASLEQQRQHMANCMECRLKAQSMQQAQAIVQQHLDTISSHYHRSNLKQLIQHRTQELAMAEYLRPANLAPGAKRPAAVSQPKRQGFWQHLTPQRSWAVVIPVSVIMTALSMWFGLAKQPEPTITGFSDSRGLVLDSVQNGPFENHHEILPYDGFQLKNGGDEGLLEVSWPEVTGARQYQLELFGLTDNVRRVIDVVETQQNHWAIDYSVLSPNQLYFLKLSGHTDEDVEFYFSSGFVVQNTNHKN